MVLKSNPHWKPDPETFDQTGEMLHGVNITAIMAKQNPFTIGFKFSVALDAKTDKDKNTKQERNEYGSITGCSSLRRTFHDVGCTAQPDTQGKVDSVNR